MSRADSQDGEFESEHHKPLTKIKAEGCPWEAVSHLHLQKGNEEPRCPFRCKDCGLRIKGSIGMGPACGCRADMNQTARVAGAWLACDRADIALSLINHAINEAQKKSMR